jgi:hypothetical protein
VVLNVAQKDNKVYDRMNYLRAGVRIPVELPVEVRWKNRSGKAYQAQGRTACISANGMFMSLPVRLRPDTAVKISVSLPVEYTRIPLELLCEGRVVGQPAGVVGVGAIIDDYEVRRVQRTL